MVSLVTGGSGLLGRTLIEALARSGEQVVALSRRTIEEDASPNVTWVRGDIVDGVDWAALTTGIDTIYHLAWSTLPHTAQAIPADDVLANVVGTLRLLEALRTRPGVRFVFASSGGTIYGRPVTLPIAESHPTRPISAYGLSKLAVERYLDFFREGYGLRPISLRISNLHGPNQNLANNFGAIATFSARAIQGQPITIFGDGGTVRDYIFVDDAVEAIIAAAASSTEGGALNVGSGVGRSLREILDLVEQLAERPIEVRYLPSRPFDVERSVLDISSARKEIGWAPQISFDVGVSRTFSGIRTRLSVPAIV